MKKIFLFMLCACLFSTQTAFAIGLSVNPGELIANDLDIGRSYDVGRVAKPLWITYGGMPPMDIVIKTYPPKEAIPGYQPIPDVSWLKFDREVYNALPDETIEVPMTLTIPDDEKYLGKNYDIRIWVGLRPKEAGQNVGVSVAVETRIMFKIVKVRGTGKKQPKIEQKVQKHLPFSLTPEQIYVDNAAVGRTVNVKSEFDASLKLVNTSAKPLTLRVKCSSPNGKGYSSPEYESIDGKDNLRFSRERVVLQPNASEEIKLYLRFQDKPENHGKKILITCEAVAENDPSAGALRTFIYVKTR